MHDLCKHYTHRWCHNRSDFCTPDEESLFLEVTFREFLTMRVLTKSLFAANKDCFICIESNRHSRSFFMKATDYSFTWHNATLARGGRFTHFELVSFIA